MLRGHRVRLVRHAQSEENAGRKPEHLHPHIHITPLGKKQSVLLARMLEDSKPERIISSNYTRAQETAHIVGKRLGITVDTWEGIHEFSFVGHELWQTMTLHKREQSIQKFFDLCDPYLSWEEGETFAQFRDRILPAEFCKKVLAAPQSDIVVITHGYVMKLIMLESMYPRLFYSWTPEEQMREFVNFHRTLRIPNTAILDMEFWGDKKRIVRPLHFYHLPRKYVTFP